MFFSDQPLTTAVRASNLLWAYEMIRSILNGDFIRGGYTSDSGMKLSVIIFLFSAYAMGQDYANTVIKITSAFWLLAGLQCMFAPESAKDAWKHGVKSERTKANAEGFGHFLVSSSLFSGSLVLFPDDITPIKACGLAHLPWLFGHVKFCLDGTYARLGIDNSKIVPWIIYHLVAAATTLL